MLEYYGLSRLGMHLLACCDVAIRPNTSDRHRKQEVATYDEVTQKIISSGAAVICFDNYNHAFGSAAIIESKNKHVIDEYDSLWISVMRHRVEQNFVILPNGTEQPSLPATKLMLKEYLDDVISKLENTLEEMNAELLVLLHIMSSLAL